MNDTSTSRTFLSKIGLLFVALFWGGGFVAAKIALDSGVTPLYISTYRFLIASIVLSIICVRILYRNIVPHIVPGIVLGILLFSAFAFQTFGLQYTTSANNAFLTATNVLIVPFLFWIIFKQAPNRYIFTGSIVAIIGIGCISFPTSTMSINIGDILTLICAFLFACHVVYINYFLQVHNLDPIKLVIIQMFVAGILSLISALLFEPPTTPFYSTSIKALLYLGLGSTLIAFLLQNIAQKYVASPTAAIILSSESLFGTIAAVIILDEIITIRLVTGGILILLAIIIAETKLQFLVPSKVH